VVYIFFDRKEKYIMKHIKRFDEKFNNRQVFYKIISKVKFDLSIKSNSKFRIGYVINEIHLDSWLTKNDLFGSLLQALIYFPSRSKMDMYLLKIELPSGDFNIKIRNVDLMLKNLTNYKKSEIKIDSDSDLSESKYPIIETIISDEVDVESIEIINMFKGDSIFTESKILPSDLKDYIFGVKDKEDLNIIGKMNTLKLVSKYLFMGVKKLFGY
jgi:hypothetical protein